MCLSTVIPNGADPDEVGVGYKVVKEKWNGFCPPIYGDWMEFDKWYKDEYDLPIYINEFCSYPTGFHIFTTEQEAITYLYHMFEDDMKTLYIVAKVQYKNVEAKGTTHITNNSIDYILNTLVVREIFVERP